MRDGVQPGAPGQEGAGRGPGARERGRRERPHGGEVSGEREVRVPEERGVQGGEERGVQGGEESGERGVQGGEESEERGVHGGEESEERGVQGGEERGVQGGEESEERGVQGGDESEGIYLQEGEGTGVQKGKVSGGTGVQESEKYDGIGVQENERTGVEEGEWMGVQEGEWTGVLEGEWTGVEEDEWTGVQEGEWMGVQEGEVPDGISPQEGEWTGVQEGEWTGVQEGEGTGVQEGEGTGVQEGERTGVQEGERTGVQEGERTGVQLFGGPTHIVDPAIELYKLAEVPDGLIGLQEGKESCAEQEEAGTGLYIMQEVPGLAPMSKEDPALTGSQRYAQLFNADTYTEAQGLENAIEEMLIRLDEFCAMVDMVRNESSIILEEKIPAMKFQVDKLNKIYNRVDKLEAFVKMVAHHVSFMEEEVTRAERDNLLLPQAFNRILSSASIPPFLRQGMKKQNTYELPTLYRTEDYFDGKHNSIKNLN
uniref:Biogenesis of lysosome-related organelles complex 1 subunit 4 n=1 Tax=Pyxicephalus adspersus TaxID=30357 RepID=A0AAV3AC45_PYXAD|nr:TPA: hypothetical protein GDO54_013019 [Pyxicephalus adspersus]